MPNFFITTHATVFYFFGKYIIGIKRAVWSGERDVGWAAGSLSAASH